MKNVLENPLATKRVINRALSERAENANAVIGECRFFSIGLPRLSQAAPQYNLSFHFVDTSAGNVTVANKSKPTISSALRKKFREHADKWYREIQMEPSLARMTSKMSYLQIIGLEPKEGVISLILNELKSKPAPWFLALKILSQNQEIGKLHAGDFNQMAQDWLEWGRENHYI